MILHPGCIWLHLATRATSRNLAIYFFDMSVHCTTHHKVKDGVYDEKSGRVVLNKKVLDDYKCPRRERMIVMDEVG